LTMGNVGNVQILQDGNSVTSPSPYGQNNW
jgi:hypothetical protein